MGTKSLFEFSRQAGLTQYASPSPKLARICGKEYREHHFPKSQIDQPLFKNLFCKLIEYPECAKLWAAASNHGRSP